VKTARQAVTEDFWAKSQAVLNRDDPFAKDALIFLAQSYKVDIEPLANAATRTLLAHSMRNPK
jgi:hypothetical protein